MAGIGLESDSSPAAVRPLGKHVDTCIIECGSKEPEKAGIYAAEGDEDEDDLFDETEYVPREEPAEESAQRQGLEVAVVENEEAEITVCEPCGEVKANTWTSPVKLTRAEVENHNLTHCPYRNWCSLCVEAMGREDPRVRQGPPEESALPVVGMDYDKYGEEEAVTDQITSIVVKDRESGQLKAHVVEVKGPKDEWIIKKVCKDVE